MAANDIQGSKMVDTLTSLLKQVRLFGYGNSELDPSLDPSLTLPPLDHGFKSANSSSDFLASEDSLCSSQGTPYQAIPYSDYGFSIEPDYNNTPTLSDSFSSYDLDKEVVFSDKSDDEEEVGSDLDLSSRRSRRQQRAREPETPQLPEYSLSEVAQHDMLHDCWMVLYDKVYDITQFLFEHPGGEELLMEHAGRDGTIAFRGVGHSKAALLSLQEYLVGVLPESERIFSTWETH